MTVLCPLPVSPLSYEMETWVQLLAPLALVFLCWGMTQVWGKAWPRFSRRCEAWLPLRGKWLRYLASALLGLALLFTCGLLVLSLTAASVSSLLLIVPVTLAGVMVFHVVMVLARAAWSVEQDVAEWVGGQLGVEVGDGRA